jgi:transcriptional regulator with XRE-family HTH domain
MSLLGQSCLWGTCSEARVDMELGSRIRSRRQELRLSLRDLAGRVGLTASFLSQIERDLTSPSLESLRRISDALEVPIFYFLIESAEKSPIVRGNWRSKLTLPESNLTYELLSRDLNRQMEPFLAVSEPGDQRLTFPLRQQTEEFIYVLEGQLEIQLDEEVHLLAPGDSVYFDGSQLRRLTAKGDTSLRFLSVITPPIF